MAQPLISGGSTTGIWTTLMHIHQNSSKSALIEFHYIFDNYLTSNNKLTHFYKPKVDPRKIFYFFFQTLAKLQGS